MKKQIFEIIDRKLMLDQPRPEVAKMETASEIADIFRKFTEWKDWQMNLRNVKHYFKRNKYQFKSEQLMTLDDLFNYWYENFKDK